MWSFIRTYPNFDKLYYNFCVAEGGNYNFIPNPSDFIIKEDILGNRIRYYDFAITAFSSFSDIPFSDENVLDYDTMQDFISWIETQNQNRNFPDFGENCNVDKIMNLQNMPTSSGVNINMAKYMVQCRVIYEENIT